VTSLEPLPLLALDEAVALTGSGPTMVRTVSEPILVDVTSLTPGPSLRETALDPDHLARLVATGGRWPPLLVRKNDLVVVDGLHRLAAAVQLQLRTTAAVLFDGLAEEAMVAAIRENGMHGLPLTLRERKRAAMGLLSIRGEWSDRMIAGICGLSGGTVNRLRGSEQQDGSDARILQLNRRIGSDGRRRPVDRAELRREIVDALDKDPTAPLRTVAARTGASPATVRAVRMALGASRQPDGGTTGAEARASQRSEREAVKTWTADSACRSAEGPEQFARWFDHTAVDPSACVLHAANVPLSRVYEVIDESLRRAKVWSEFASKLQSRPLRHQTAGTDAPAGEAIEGRRP
jgi:ParB-like chromosome segregation protein Spo0J